MANKNERTSIPKRLSLQLYPPLNTESKSVTTFGSAQEDITIPSSTASWIDSFRASYLSFDRHLTLDPEATFLNLDPSLDRHMGQPESDLESDRRSESSGPDMPPSGHPLSLAKSLPRGLDLAKVKVRGETYSREITTPHDHGQSATERLHHFAQHDPSERSLWKRFSSMYGRESYDEKLAELWATEFQGSVQYPNRSTRAVLLISAILPYIIGSLDHAVIATLIPTFISQFNEPADIGWYASAYFLPFALLMPTLGKCYSLWNVKWLFLVSLLFHMGGSILCALSTTSAAFIAGRSLSGSGAAGILQGALRILAMALPGTQRMYMEGIGVILMGACIMSGPLIGGVIADSIGWQWVFWVNIPPSSASFVAILFLFPDDDNSNKNNDDDEDDEKNEYGHHHMHRPRPSRTKPPPLFALATADKIQRLDPVGSALLVLTLGCAITVLQDYSYSADLRVGAADVGLAAVAGVGFVLFLAQEALVRPDLALIPRSLVRRRAVWASSLLLFVVFAGFENFVFFMSIFQQVVQSETAADSAVHLLPYVISASIAAGVTAFGATKLRYYNPFFILGGALFTIGMGFVSRIDDTITQHAKFSYEVLVGTGVGLMVLGNIAPCHIDLPEKDHAIGNGLTGLGGALGASVAVPVSSALFNHALRAGVEALDVPLSVKVAVVTDITNITRNVPAEYRAVVLNMLAAAVRRAFIFGLTCAALCIVLTLLIPWKAIRVSHPPIVRAGSKLPFSRGTLGKV